MNHKFNFNYDPLNKYILIINKTKLLLYKFSDSYKLEFLFAFKYYKFLNISFDSLHSQLQKKSYFDSDNFYIRFINKQLYLKIINFINRFEIKPLFEFKNFIEYSIPDHFFNKNLVFINRKSNKLTILLEIKDRIKICNLIIDHFTEKRIGEVIYSTISFSHFLIDYLSSDIIFLSINQLLTSPDETLRHISSFLIREGKILF